MTAFNRQTLAYAVTLMLVFVWSIPGTIALRTLLLLGGLALAASSPEAWSRSEGKRRFPASLAMLAVLSTWWLLQALLVSEETAWALGELRGQWLTALVALGLGILMSRLDSARPQVEGSALWTGIALVFAAQAAIAVAQSLWHWTTDGSMLRGEVPLTGGKLEMSYIVNILLAIVTVDLFCRAANHRTLLRLPVPASLACAALGLTANYLAGSRNGVLGTLFLAASVVGLLLIDGRKRIGSRKTLLMALALVVGTAVFAIANFVSDPRWKTFSETARIAVDIDNHKAWYDVSAHPLPLLSNGEPVEASAYVRIAWLSAGMRLARDVPLGVGYGRNAFVRALRKQYPAKLGHSHSGFVDLLASGGLPAVILWLAFAGSLVSAGWRSFTAFRSPRGLLLILLVGGYTGRMLIESVSRDHMLQIFFFLVGALLFADTARARNPGQTPGRGEEKQA